MRKEFQKKEKGTGAAGPTRLPFGPASSPACLPLPSLSHARRPPCPIPRRPRGGRTPVLGAPRPTTPSPWSRRRPAPLDRSLHSVARAFSLLPPCACAAAAAAPPAPFLEKAPPVAPELQPRRQGHQRTRRRRGKPLRTLYRGEKQSCAVNRSSELLRPRRRAPPRRILLYPASFRSFFGALGR